MSQAASQKHQQSGPGTTAVTTLCQAQGGRGGRELQAETTSNTKVTLCAELYPALIKEIVCYA